MSSNKVVREGFLEEMIPELRLQNEQEWPGWERSSRESCITRVVQTGGTARAEVREERKDSTLKAEVNSWRWGWGERRGVAGDKGRSTILGSSWWTAWRPCE